MLKEYINIDVLEAAQQRISWTFDNFERVYLSFSGGKDSTVMLHLVMAEAIKRQRKIGMLCVDLEAQYKMTMDHVRKCYELYKDHVEPYWVCLPISLRNDYWGKGLGFTQHKSAAYQKYLDLMRRRNETWNVDQQALGFVVKGATP